MILASRNMCYEVTMKCCQLRAITQSVQRVLLRFNIVCHPRKTYTPPPPPHKHHLLRKGNSQVTGSLYYIRQLLYLIAVNSKRILWFRRRVLCTQPFLTQLSMSRASIPSLKYQTISSQARLKPCWALYPLGLFTLEQSNIASAPFYIYGNHSFLNGNQFVFTSWYCVVHTG